MLMVVVSVMSVIVVWVVSVVVIGVLVSCNVVNGVGDVS